MRIAVTLIAALLSGCGDGEPTVTFPASWCHVKPTGETRHQHRSAWTQSIPHSDGKGHIYFTHIFHAARDWDEEVFVTTCAKQEWLTVEK
jgi:hypothetical protein